MLYKFLFTFAFLLFITNAQDDLDDDLSNALDDNNDDFGDVALASAEAASLFSTTSDSIDGTASTQDSFDGTGSAEATGSAEVTSSGDDDDEDDSFDPTDFSIDATEDSDDTSDDDSTSFEVTGDSNDDDDSTADDDDDDSNDSDDGINSNEESDDGAASLDDETDDSTNDVTSQDGDASADIDIEEECAALENVEDCRDDIDDDGDQLCAYSETDGCYAIVRRAGRNGQGTFDQGFEKAMGSAQNKSTALYTVVGVLAGVIGALLIVIFGGAYYLYNKSQKTDHMTAVEFVEQGNIVEIDDTTPIYTH